MAELIQVASSGGPGGKFQVASGGFEFYNFTFTPGVEGAGATDGIDTVCQLTDATTGQPIKKRIACMVYFSVDPNDFAVAIISGGLTVVTGTLIRSMVSNGLLYMLTDANGVLTVRAVVAGAGTRYMNIVLPDGRIASSTLLTWAA